MDINFFEPIRKKKNKTNYANLLILAVPTITLALLVLLCIGKKVEYIQIKGKVNNINSTMDDPVFQEQLKSVSVKEKELEEITKMYDKLLILSSSAQGYHTVKEEVLKSLQDELTQSLYVEKLSITGDQMSLDGYAANVQDVTQFEYNLRHCGLFENVIVNTVQEEMATYLFSGTQIVQTVYNYSFNIQNTISDSSAAQSSDTDISDENIEEE